MTGSKTKFAIVVFPGSNCEQDCHHVATELLGLRAEYVWHHDTDLKSADVVILPGGFAYGDYLRAGALARFSPVMESVIRFAMDGGPVLGICNGFQVLLEAGLLPGAVRVNRGLRYLCRDVHMRVENASTVFTRLYEPGQVVRMPIGHGEGNYTAPPEALTELEYEAGVVFRYCDEAGRVTDESNPNGATAGIAGISNREGNIVGPDAAPGPLRGGTAGQRRREEDVRVGRRLARAGMTPGAITPDLVAEHNLSPEEYERILEILGREPNLVELGIFSAMWSEHCSYKSSRIHLKNLPTTGPARDPGARRKRRDRGHRRRAGRRVQDGVAQPSVVPRALPGRGDRRRRHPAGHLHDGRPAHRVSRLAPLRARSTLRACGTSWTASSAASRATGTAWGSRPSRGRPRSTPRTTATSSST